MFKVKGVKETKLELRALSEALDINMTTMIQKTIFDVLDGITSKNPVLTGRSRASWNVTLGKVDPSNLPASGFSVDGGISIGEISSILNSRKAGLEIKPYAKYFITNSVEYIEALENGHSKRAPNGMVAITVSEFTKVVRAALKVARGPTPVIKGRRK